MGIIDISILSFVQGVSEWLPISSSGHLVLFEKWLDFEGASLSFDVFLHIASLLVIVLFFRKQILEVLKSPFGAQENVRTDWWWYLIISNIFTAVIGYFLYQNIESFRTVESVSNWLIVTSILLIASKFGQGNKDFNWKHAVALGIIQGLAVLPGLSRSGAVIALALAMKIKKSQAFDYGFLVAIPAMLGSFILTFGDMSFEAIYLWGFLLTFVVGYLSLILLKKIMKRNSLYLFFAYTIILSLILKVI